MVSILKNKIKIQYCYLADSRTVVAAADNTAAAAVAAVGTVGTETGAAQQ